MLFVIKVSLFAFFLVLYGRENSARLVPFTPCSDLFNYFESQTWEIFGAMTFKNDLSGTYDLEVNMSIPLDTNKTITIARRTEEFNIQQGKGIEYYVGFPYNHSFPKLTSVKFNGKIYCTGPPEVANEEHGVTPLSATDHFSTTIPEETIRRHAEAATSTTTTTTTTAPIVDIKIKNDDECGINIDYKPLIFSGHSTRSGEYPWLVALFTVEAIGGYSFICGGSLVSKKHIITAAHCMRDILGTSLSKDDIIVVLGKHNIKNWVLGSTIRSVKAYYVHPDYRKPADADIAVLLLDAPVSFSVTVRPICLWDENDGLGPLVEKNGTVAGWGKDESGVNWVEEPKQIQLPIVSQETCLRSDIRYVKLTSTRTFCAGNVKESRGPCSGDSGGGFVMNRNGIWKLRGIVSIALLDPASRICDINNYVVFTDVPKYATWLKQVMEYH